MHKFTTENQAKTYLNLISFETMDKIELKMFSGFSIGGHNFLGSYEYAAEKFAVNNPDGGDFLVWLQDNWNTI